MVGDDGRMPYQDLLNSWADVLRAASSIVNAFTSRGGSADGAAPPPAVEVDQQFAALLGEISQMLVTGGARYWIGAAETMAKLLSAIDRDLRASRENPTQVAAARAALVDEFRAGLRSLTDLSYQESRRAQTEFDTFARRFASDVQRGTSTEHWRRWTVKP